MKLVGMMSTYREGRLTLAAVRSLEPVGLDDLLIYEGPAGEPIDADVPDSEFPAGWTVTRGSWRSDARKRQAMLERAKSLYPDQPLWGLILDGDEVLVNGEYLRDQLQSFEWSQPDKPNWPILLSEGDGTLSTLLGRVVRLDRIRRYIVSTSVLELVDGSRPGWGNSAAQAQIFMEMIDAAGAAGKMMAWPPFPCQPHIFHRSGLRHPGRAGNRMHAQEAAELRREGITP